MDHEGHYAPKRLRKDESRGRRVALPGILSKVHDLGPNIAVRLGLSRMNRGAMVSGLCPASP
jgi:hypothetical protein